MTTRMKSRLERLERALPTAPRARTVQEMTDAELIQGLLEDAAGHDFEHAWSTICEEVLANAQKDPGLNDEEFQVFAEAWADNRPAFEAVWRRMQANQKGNR